MIILSINNNVTKFLRDSLVSFPRPYYTLNILKKEVTADQGKCKLRVTFPFYKKKLNKNNLRWVLFLELCL